MLGRTSPCAMVTPHKNLFQQILVVADGQLKMAGVDPLFLLAASGVAGQLANLSCEVLHHGRQVDGSAGTSPAPLRSA